MKSRQDFGSDAEYNNYLRKYFAAMALQGILAHSTNYMAAAHSDAVKDAIKCADELLKQLES